MLLSWCRPVGNDADMSSGIRECTIPQCFWNQPFRCALLAVCCVQGLLAMTARPPIRTAHTEAAESAVFKRYAPKLEAIAALDRAYYATPSPSLIERTDYYQRQAVLQRIRLRLYAELDRVRQRAGHLPITLPS